MIRWPKRPSARSRGSRAAPIAASIRAPRTSLRELLARGGGLCRRRHARARRPLGAARSGRHQAHPADEIAMATLIFGVVVLSLVLMVLNAFTKTNPRTVALVLKTAGGVGALGGAALLGAARPDRSRDAARRRRLEPARLAAVERAGLRLAHAEERRPGLARALGVPGDGARSRHRRDARTHPRRPARGRRASIPSTSPR